MTARETIETLFESLNDSNKLSMNDVKSCIDLCNDYIKILTIKRMQNELDNRNTSETKIVIQTYDNFESKDSDGNNTWNQRVVYNDDIILRFVKTVHGTNKYNGYLASYSIYVNESLVIKKERDKNDFANISNMKSAMCNLENSELMPHEFLKLLVTPLEGNPLYEFEELFEKIYKDPHKYYLEDDRESMNSSIESDLSIESME